MLGGVEGCLMGEAVTLDLRDGLYVLPPRRGQV